MNLIENVQIVEALQPQANTGALVGDYISMKKAEHVTVLVHLLQGHATPPAITLEQATAVAGTGSKALAVDVPIFLVADCASSDLWVRQTDGVAFTPSAALKHNLIAFEVPAEALDMAGGFDCLCVKIAASDVANLVSATYIASKLRYGPASLIVD